MQRLHQIQTTHVLGVHCILSLHRWSEVKPTKNDDVIYEQVMDTNRYITFWSNKCFIKLANTLTPNEVDEMV